MTDVGLFIDSTISQQLSTYRIRGAQVSVVKDGQLYFSNGYGFYHNDTGPQPVTANTSLFMVASLSKALTATAIMQLVEDGLIDLDADVNDYLEAFKVPNTFSEPITIEHLLTHTSGLENTLAPVYVNTAEGLPSLEDALIAELPHRIIKPGVAAMYSNFGYALLGYIVEVVSGMSFPDYIRSEIFEPLGMNNSYFEQVIPTAVEGQLSGGYSYSYGEGFILQPPEFATTTPGAGLMTTAEDYGRFLIAHLNNGTYDGTRILDNDTVQQMHDVYFEARPGFDGVCFGFYERDMNNLEGIGHGGITYRFHSTSLLLLEENIGLYVSYNTDTANAAGAELMEAFVDRYYPASLSITPLEGHEERANRYVGEYINSHSYFSTAQKLEFFTARTFEYMRVTENSDGTIQVQRVRSHSEVVSYEAAFVEVEPGYFLDASGDTKTTIAFLENENGEMTHLYFSWFPPETWVRKASFEMSLMSLIIIQIVALGSLVFLPIFMLIELRSLWKYRKEEKALSRAVRFLTLGGITISIIWLFSMLGIAISVVETYLLLLFTSILMLIFATGLLYNRRKKVQIDYLGSLTRFVSAAHYSLVVPAFTLVSLGTIEWRTLTTLSGSPATWVEIISGYHASMYAVFILMAAYLVSVIGLAALVAYSWTEKGGRDTTSYRSIIERVMYTFYLALSIIVVWILNQWGAFAFIV
ncbi:MAG: serine hydrolase domain-containing protein [Candidatus Thorarchaeota archaeon]